MIQNLTKSFKALADSNRLRILLMLQKKSLCVCEITEILGLATSTVSKHLSILRDSGFITSEKDGRWVNYELVEDNGNRYTDQLMDLIAQWTDEVVIASDDMEKVEQVDRYKITEG